MLESYLKSLVADPVTVRPFRLKKLRTKGTPVLWQESLEVEMGGLIQYTRTRSFHDEGGEAIGKWHQPASEERIKGIATALLDSLIWEMQAQPVLPGAMLNRWQIDYGDESFVLVEGGRRDDKLKTLNIIFRRIINRMTGRHQGRVLACEYTPENSRITLVNRGSEDLLVCNPLFEAMTSNNFIAVQAAREPRQTPGVTAPAMVFKNISLVLPTRPPAPFDKAFLQIGAQTRLELPVQAAVADYRGQCLRAAYSNYSIPEDAPGSLLIQGCVFSQPVRMP